MEKIPSFKIEKLRLAGFKKFGEPTEFEFGDMTSISGHNSQGKSSIAEAITYAITGVPYFGGEKSIDRLYTMGIKSMSVSLTIEINGNAHELLRERRNDDTTVTFDGVQIRQSDLNIMFGERDIFLSIFNPLYFIEELGDKGRNLLERYLPAIPNEDVMTRLSEENRTLIERSNMLSPEGLLKRLRSEIKQLRDDIIYIEGQRDLLTEQNSNRKNIISEKKKELKKLGEALMAIQARKIEGIDIKDMQERLNALHMRLDEFSHDSKVADVQELNPEILQLIHGVEQRRAGQYQSKFTDALTEVSVKLLALGGMYRQEKAVYDSLSGMQCPTCKRDITAEELPNIKAEYAKIINALASEGRETAAQQAELIEHDQKAREVFEQFKSDDIAKLEERLEEARTRNSCDAETAGSNSSRPDEISEIKAKIRSLELGMINGNLSPEEAAAFDEQIERYNNLYREIDALNAAGQPTPDDKAQSIDEMKAQIIEKEALATAVQFYISERVGLMFGSFDMLNRVSIQLYDIAKTTGEIKDVFKFTYDGRPYKYLSYSEKVKAGLEISDLLKTLTGSDYPVFIDNGESVPVIDNIRQSGQVIFSQVVKSKPLTVTPINMPAQAAA